MLNRLPENSIEIEGHTDNVPIENDDFANNHWLSSARALQVLDIFADDIGIERKRLAAMGYGEFKRILRARPLLVIMLRSPPRPVTHSKERLS